MNRHIISWLVILGVISLIGNPDSYVVFAGNFVTVRGGGMGEINCPGGSSLDANLSFVAITASNGTISGNWTLFNFNSDSPGPGNISQGPFYSGNISLSSYNVEGETVDEQDRIFICDQPLFGPLTISGSCGRDIEITIGFETDDPFQVAEPFIGSADCQTTIED